MQLNSHLMLIRKSESHDSATEKRVFLDLCVDYSKRGGEKCGKVAVVKLLPVTRVQ